MEEKNTKKLVSAIIEGIQRKKGNEIVRMDLRSLEHSVCKYFVICHGDSNTQVNAIADSVEEYVEENLNESVWHKQGKQNAHWVLLDYADVVVHIFQKPYRNYYKLEELWADAELRSIEDE